jgi:Effector-associated domain 1
MTRINLTGAQSKDLTDALQAAYPTHEHMVRLLASVNQSFIDLSAANEPLWANRMRAVNEAQQGGWLLELVGQAVKENPDDPAFSELLTQLGPAPLPPGIDHFETVRLTGSFVMVDRAMLRTSLRVISQRTGPRILVVRGCPRSGKSHTLQFISYLAQMLDSFFLVPIDLEDLRRMLGPRTAITPMHVAEQLVQWLEYDIELPPAPVDRQWAKWVGDFCTKFQMRAQRDPEPRWIVIDSFNCVRVPQATLGLVKELALRISQTLHRYRLVLLGFDQTIPPKAHGHLKNDEIGPIGLRDVIEFLELACRQDGRPCDRQTLLDAAERVLDGLQEEHQDFLFELTPRLVDELERLPSNGAAN